MTISARPLTRSTAARRASSITTLLIAALALACLTASVAAPVAQAKVVSIGPVPVGELARVGATTAGEPATYANAEGHPVVHNLATYLIYWDPTDHYHGDWQTVIDTFMHQAGASSGQLASVFDVASQYTDKTDAPASWGSDFHGSYTDIVPYPASGCKDPEPYEEADRIGAGLSEVCLTSTQIADEVEAEIKREGLPTGMDTIYYVLTPPGVTVCLDAGGASGHCSDYSGSAGGESYDDSFCSYHSDINPGGPAMGSSSTILYGVIPWTAGGYGDPHLSARDEDLTPGWRCQDGGHNPKSRTLEVEQAHERSTKEQQAFEEGTLEEKAKAELIEELEGPHEQEPNQKVPCPSDDGGCDVGLADLIINQISSEQLDIVTDPLLNGWQDGVHDENVDECRFDFAPAKGNLPAEPESRAGTLYDQTFGGYNYYLDDAFNLAAGRLPYPGVPCMNGVVLEPLFTAPNTVNSGEVVAFNGMESDITLNAGIDFPDGGAAAANYATYRWELGDGTVIEGYAPGAPVCESPWLSPCAASVFHTYAYGGTYTVTLTVTDVGGNVASVSHEVTVDGPPAPGSGGSSGGSGGSSGGSGGATATVVNPVAEATVLSRSLPSALRRGLLVSYSVNEQVAGHFEVLLSSSLAHRLGIGGARATGLPAGTPAQVIVAKALLVTTKGGQSTIAIRFSKAVERRLSRSRRLPLMLRLIVRNASSKSPATTTVLASATLTR